MYDILLWLSRRVGIVVYTICSECRYRAVPGTLPSQAQSGTSSGYSRFVSDTAPPQTFLKISFSLQCCLVLCSLHTLFTTSSLTTTPLE